MCRYFNIANNTYINGINNEILLEKLKSENTNLEYKECKYQTILKYLVQNNSVKEKISNNNILLKSSLLFSDTYKDLIDKIEDIQKRPLYSKSTNLCFLHQQTNDKLYLISFFVYDNIPYFLHYEEYLNDIPQQEAIKYFYKNVNFRINLLKIRVVSQSYCYYTNLFNSVINVSKKNKKQLNTVDSVSYLTHIGREILNKYETDLFNIENFIKDIEQNMTYNKLKIDYFNTSSSHKVKIELKPKIENYNLSNPEYIKNIKNFWKKDINSNEITFFTDASLRKNHNGGGIVILTEQKAPVYVSLKYKDKHLKNAETPDELECLTILYALKFAIENKIKNVKIYTDSQHFLSAFYQVDKELYNELSKFINKIYYCAIQLNITFVKVKAHSDNYYNNIADYLAKRRF